MARIKLTERQKEGVKEWMGLGLQGHRCPFAGIMEHDPDGYKTCKSWFPKIRMNECPCKVYTLGHVRKIAKRMVEEKP